MLVEISRECTSPYLSTGISNLLQPAQTEVVLGQRSTYLASWAKTLVQNIFLLWQTSEIEGSKTIFIILLISVYNTYTNIGSLPLEIIMFTVQVYKE